jgi:transcriptional regulator with XRE-family HTH domain
MSINLDSFGMRVRRKRKEMGITQARLAELCEVSVPFIGHIERGSRSPSVESLLVICRVLEVTPDYLLQDYLNFDHSLALGARISNSDIQSLERISKVLREQAEDWPD